MPRLSKTGAASLAAFGWTAGSSGLSASYLVVAGGGGGGAPTGGGGGERQRQRRENALHCQRKPRNANAPAGHIGLCGAWKNQCRRHVAAGA